MRSAGFLLTGLALTALGCSSLAPEDDTYAKTVQGIEGTADWSCLGQTPPPPPVITDPVVTYTFPLVEWVTSQPLPGRTIKVCNRIDAACSKPLVAPTTIVDSDPNVSVQLQAGQSLFLLLEAPGVLPTTLYFDGPLYSSQEGGKISMLTPDTVGSLAAQVQILPDPSLGILAIRPHDCRGNIASGALYTIDAPANGPSVPYAFSNGYPRAANPPAPSLSTTIASDNTPWAGFVNVPPIGVTVYGVLADDRREIGQADIPVRPATVNAVEIRPLNHL